MKVSGPVNQLFSQVVINLNWSQIVTSIGLLKCYQNLATLLRAQAVKQFAHRFLNISCSGRQVGKLLFLFGKS